MLAVIALLTTPIYFFLARSFFGEWEGFFESIVAKFLFGIEKPWG